MVKKIKSFIELKKCQQELEEMLAQPPYKTYFSVDFYGSFECKADAYLTPEEALKLGTFLVNFYKDAM